MIQTQRILLSFICALSLMLIPLTLGAQEPYPQDRTDVNEGNVDQDLNQDESQIQDEGQSLQDDSEVTREKPSSTTPDPSTMQNQNPDRPSETQSDVTDTESDVTQTDELPATAGALPLLALLGGLSLAAAAGTHIRGRFTR